MKNSILVAIAFVVMLLGATSQGWTASLVARIDISSQTMTVTKNGRIIHKWRVSTARSGYITPRGTYSLKYFFHKSLQGAFCEGSWNVS